LKKRFVTPLLAVGILILIVAPLATISYGLNGRVLYRIPTQIRSEGGSVVQFALGNWTHSHTLAINLSLPVMVNTSKYPIYPYILDIILLDSSNMTLLENNQTPNYLYLHAYGIENSTTFDIQNINKSGQYYLVIYNVIPVNGTASTTFIEEWYSWSVNPLSYPMIALGAIIVGVTISFSAWQKLRKYSFNTKRR
jgi:hypothetical protein